MDSILVDTGFLVALGRRSDPLHEKANAFLQGYSGKLATASPVIVETCFFFESAGKAKLLEWVQSGGLAVAEVPVAAYSDLSGIISRYADRDVDFADAALVWLANETGLRGILTTDETDFGVFRLKASRRFELVEWMD